MEQVEQLMADKSIHPAAPIALAGAALKSALRSLWEQAGQPELKGRPGINAYATALTPAPLDRQDVKDITSWAGLRNAAAHGEFDVIDLNRARHMAEGVNLFMQRRAPRTP